MSLPVCDLADDARRVPGPVGTVAFPGKRMLVRLESFCFPLGLHAIDPARAFVQKATRAARGASTGPQAYPDLRHVRSFFVLDVLGQGEVVVVGVGEPRDSVSARCRPDPG